MLKWKVQTEIHWSLFSSATWLCTHMMPEHRTQDSNSEIVSWYEMFNTEQKTDTHRFLHLRWWFEVNTRLKLIYYYPSDDDTRCIVHTYDTWTLSTRLKLRDYYLSDDGLGWTQDSNSWVITPQMMVWDVLYTHMIPEHRTQTHGLLPLRWWYEMYCTHIWYLNTRLKPRDYYSSDDGMYCAHVWYLNTRLELRDYYSSDDGMYCTHIWYLNIVHKTNRQRALEAGAVVDWSSIVYRVLCCGCISCSRRTLLSWKLP